MMNSSTFAASCSIFALVAACGSETLDGGSSDDALYVRQALARGAATDDQACVYRPDAAWPALSRGTLDLDVRDRYDATLLLESKAGGFRLEGAHVRVVSAGSGPVIGEVDAVVGGVVDSGGVGVATFQAIDPALTAKLRTMGDTRQPKDVVLEITVRASPVAGSGISSAPTFSLPLTVCNGCLIDFANSDDPLVPGRDCNLSPATQSRTPCRMGQDETFWCGMCRDSVPACRSSE